MSHALGVRWTNAQWSDLVQAAQILNKTPTDVVRRAVGEYFGYEPPIPTPRDQLNIAELILGHFGEHLKAQRVSRNLSLRAMGEATGISHATLAYFEHGRMMPTPAEREMLNAWMAATPTT